MFGGIFGVAYLLRGTSECLGERVAWMLRLQLGFFLVCSQNCMVMCTLCSRAVQRLAPELQLVVAAVASVQIDVVWLSRQHQRVYRTILPPAEIF